MQTKSDTHQTIEHASRGATYQNSPGTFTVYEIGIYPESSVLAGQTSRTWLDQFDSLEAARAAYPDAQPAACSYREPSLDHLPDPEGSDPYGDNAAAAEEGI